MANDQIINDQNDVIKSASFLTAAAGRILQLLTIIICDTVCNAEYYENMGEGNLATIEGVCAAPLREIRGTCTMRTLKRSQKVTQNAQALWIHPNNQITLTAKRGNNQFPSF